MMKKMKIDFLYNMIYQMLVLLVPLITTPYLSRILGVTGIGIYSYTYSIVYYFMIFALLGINNYGSRIIAKNKDDIIKTSKEFFSLYSLQFILGICSIFLYLICLLLIILTNKMYKSKIPPSINYYRNTLRDKKYKVNLQILILYFLSLLF